MSTLTSQRITSEIYLRECEYDNMRLIIEKQQVFAVIESSVVLSETTNSRKIHQCFSKNSSEKYLSSF